MRQTLHTPAPRPAVPWWDQMNRNNRAVRRARAWNEVRDTAQRGIWAVLVLGSGFGAALALVLLGTQALGQAIAGAWV